MPKTSKKRNAASATLPQLPPITLSVHRYRGFESFPTDPSPLDACVTVDNHTAVAPGSSSSELPSEIGSGACVHPTGLVLTAGHVAPSIGAVRRVSFPSGRTYDAVCIRTGTSYDLALLQIRTSGSAGRRGGGRRVRSRTGTDATPLRFPSVRIAARPAEVRSRVACVGQPGVRAKIRLEANVGRCVSQSSDPLRDQSEIGGIVHDCPVYGGSSGSPLLAGGTGELVGVHTGFDHGRFEAQAVTLEAVKKFLDGTVLDGVAEDDGDGVGDESESRVTRVGDAAEGAEDNDGDGDGDSDSDSDECDSSLPLVERLKMKMEQRAQSRRSVAT